MGVDATAIEAALATVKGIRDALTAAGRHEAAFEIPDDERDALGRAGEVLRSVPHL
jgi:hypothetical protein